MATVAKPFEKEDSRSIRSSPSTWWKAGAILLLIGILYIQVLADLVHDWWTEPSLSYGLLIPPLALYVAWVRRQLTFALPAHPENKGLLFIAISCSLYALGKLGAEFYLPRISFVLLLAGLVWTFWGAARLRSLALPFLLLATMVPLPVIIYNAMAAPLQLFASDLAATIAQACGVSVFRDGNILNLAHVSLGVEEACSGLSSLSALIVGSVLLGFMLLSRITTRWILFLLTIPLAIGVNVCRVAITAIMADYHKEFAMGFYHAFSGWLVFIIGFVSQYAVAALLQHLTERQRAS